jgi:hypothetical protein
MEGVDKVLRIGEGQRSAVAVWVRGRWVTRGRCCLAWTTSLRPGQRPPQVTIAATTSFGLWKIIFLGPALRHHSGRKIQVSSVAWIPSEQKAPADDSVSYSTVCSLTLSLSPTNPPPLLSSTRKGLSLGVRDDLMVLISRISENGSANGENGECTWRISRERDFGHQSSDTIDFSPSSFFDEIRPLPKEPAT